MNIIFATNSYPVTIIMFNKMFNKVQYGVVFTAGAVQTIYPGCIRIPGGRTFDLHSPVVYGGGLPDSWLLANDPLKRERSTAKERNAGDCVKNRNLLSLKAANRVTISAIIMFLITSVHHVYGAYVYHTPWRLHAALVSGVTTALLRALLSRMRKQHRGAVRRGIYRAFLWLTLLIPFLGFGVFEGAYNHTLKLALYFAHAAPGLMTRLFPPPTYEMPNNVAFEITGVMQIVPGFMVGYHLYQFVRNGKHSPPRD